MEFIQIMELRTSSPDELRASEEEWRKATEGKRTLRRSILTRDRNDPDRYLVLAFFDDYESAMVNSNLSETSEFAQKQGSMLDGPPSFTDLDVVDDQS